MVKLWAHSGDSHFLEPEDLFQQILPPKLAERMPWSERDGDDEIVHVDGQSLPPQAAEARDQEGQRRPRHHGAQHASTGRARHPRPTVGSRPRGRVGRGHLPVARAVEPLDQGPRAGARPPAAPRTSGSPSEIQGVAPDRLVPTAQLPLLTVQHAVDEVYHVAEIGLHAVSLPDRTSGGCRRLQPGFLGTAVGGHRRDRSRPVVPHRLRRQRHRVDVPRPRRRGPQLRRDDVRRATFGDEAGHVGRARPSPDDEGAGVRRAAPRGCRSSATA